MKGKINYSDSLFQRLKNDFRTDILNAAESSKDMKDEIKRVFQIANRRIQNIEKAGIYSPAVKSLHLDSDRYSKFSVGGKSWKDLKIDYAKAVQFLKQPTSMASGARQYNEHIRTSYDLTKQEYSDMIDYMSGKLDSIKSSEYVEQYLMRYKDFSGELERAAQDISDQIESDAEQLSKALQQDIEHQADDAASEMTENVRRIYDELKDML